MIKAKNEFSGNLAYERNLKKRCAMKYSSQLLGRCFWRNKEADNLIPCKCADN